MKGTRMGIVRLKANTMSMFLSAVQKTVSVKISMKLPMPRKAPTYKPSQSKKAMAKDWRTGT
jgi:hypothetical protein